MYSVLYRITNIPEEVLEHKVFEGLEYEVHHMDQDFAERLMELNNIKDDKHVFELFSKYSGTITIFKAKKELGADEFELLRSDGKMPSTMTALWNQSLLNDFSFYPVLEYIYCKPFQTLSILAGVEIDSKFELIMKAGGDRINGFPISNVKVDLGLPTSKFDKIYEAYENKLIRLTLDGFSVAVRTSNKAVRFGMIMSSFDALLGIGSASNYAIPRNCAVLLSRNVEEGHTIFDEVKALYSIRSAVVHECQIEKVDQNQIEQAIYYFRAAVDKLIALDMLDKQKLKVVFNQSGYGTLTN